MKKTVRLIFKISKALHKYIGLIFLAYFLLMGISGILLNHPSLIRWFSVSMAWVPESYVYSNWNRMAFREAVFSTKDHDTLYVCGKTGVWESRDRGKSFVQMENGFPVSPYDTDIRCLLLTESGGAPHLYAGVLSGEINPKKLSDKDSGLLMYFYTRILKRDIDEVPYRTLMNKPEVWEFVEKILARLKGQF